MGTIPRIRRAEKKRTENNSSEINNYPFGTRIQTELTQTEILKNLQTSGDWTQSDNGTLKNVNNTSKDDCRMILVESRSGR